VVQVKAGANPLIELRLLTPAQQKQVDSQSKKEVKKKS
jgi:hypothetical protein